MKRLELKYIQDIVKKLGHKPLFNKSVTNREFIKCECKKHGVFTVKVANLLRAYKIKKGNGCRKCGDESKTTLKQVYKKFEELNLEPKFTKYMNGAEDLPFVCKKHPELGIQYTKFRNLQQGTIRPCKKCSSENMSKKRTKPFKTKAKRDLRRYSSLYRKWRKIILNIFQHKCIRCGATENLIVHHILPVKYFPEKIVETNNGIVLCEKCHKEYHKRFSINKKDINHSNSFMTFLKELPYIKSQMIKSFQNNGDE